MTQEEKQLLLKDICARLPYGLVCKVEFKDSEGWKKQNMLLEGVSTYQCYFESKAGSIYSKEFKPYLRPMSSMTEEECKEFYKISGLWKKGNYFSNHLSVEWGNSIITEMVMVRTIDWLNSHHFDYRGLIDKGLALEAKDGMYES